MDLRALANHFYLRRDLQVLFEFLEQKVLATFFAKGVGGFTSHLWVLVSDLQRGKQFAAISFLQMINCQNVKEKLSKCK